MLSSSMGSFRTSKLIFHCLTHYKIRLPAPGSVSAIPVTVYRDLNFIAQDLNDQFQSQKNPSFST